MKNKHSILLTRLLTFMIAAVLTVTGALALNTQTVNAGIYTDIFGGSGDTGGKYTKNGCSDSRLGYLCYPVAAEGGADIPGGSAIFLTAPGWSPVAGATPMLTTRKNHYAPPSGPTGTADWNLKPFTYSNGSYITHQAEIKQWFEESGGQQGGNFVEKYWGNSVAEKFAAGEYVIVVETVMNFQWSTTDGVAEKEMNYSDALALVEATYGKGLNPAVFNAAHADKLISDSELERALEALATNSTAGLQQAQGTYELIVNAVLAEAKRRNMGNNQTLHGTPVTGTVPNLLTYKKALGLTNTRLDSWVNGAAPDAEKILPGGPGEKAGYVANTNPPLYDDGTLTTPTNGLAMFVISCKDGQTTCDEPKIPKPHDPPKESEGERVIIKNYRTRIVSTGELIEDGNNFIMRDVCPNITIENEEKYVVVGL